jgi:hypothetical protein
MSDFVQFIHPGAEHGADSGSVKSWNRGAHRRKFLEVEGDYLEEADGTLRRAPVVLWAEWEPESDAAPITIPVDDGPRWLHRPFYVRPRTYRPGGDPLQNTDPFVFGEHFRYTLCRQWRNKTNRPTLLRDLAVGSLILFGSLKGGSFVLDTVFVTGQSTLHDHGSWRTALPDLPETYVDVTMKPTYAWGPGPQLRHYSGASYSEPVDDMFSFAPCLPANVGRNGFARPTITLDGYVTQGLMMGFKATRGLKESAVRDLWRRVVDQVVDADLALGSYFALPARRDA